MKKPRPRRRRRGRPPGASGSLTVDVGRTLKMDLVAGADEVDATLASFVERLLLSLRPTPGDTTEMVRAYADQLSREVAQKAGRG